MGLTPLMLAASKGRADLIGLLLKHGADRTARDWMGRGVLDHAASNDRQAIAQALRF